MQTEQERLKILRRAARKYFKTLPKAHATWLPLAIALNECPHEHLQHHVPKNNYSAEFWTCPDCGARKY